MSVDRIEKGMLAKSKAGHDKGQVYVIYEVDETYVYLADGKKRTVSSPKRKKKKHIQPICKKYDVTGMDDVGVKRVLKLFDREMRRN